VNGCGADPALVRSGAGAAPAPTRAARAESAQTIAHPAPQQARRARAPLELRLAICAARQRKCSGTSVPIPDAALRRAASSAS
jgi:hypothetical protein